MNINITSVSNPQYSKADNSTIDCIVTCDEVAGNHPFTAAAHDPEEHGRQLFTDLLSGKYGAIAPYVAP